MFVCVHTEGRRGKALGVEGAAKSVAETPARPGTSPTAGGAHPQEREDQERGCETSALSCHTVPSKKKKRKNMV